MQRLHQEATRQKLRVGFRCHRSYGTCPGTPGCLLAGMDLCPGDARDGTEGRENFFRILCTETRNIHVHHAPLDLNDCSREMKLVFQHGGRIPGNVLILPRIGRIPPCTGQDQGDQPGCHPPSPLYEPTADTSIVRMPLRKSPHRSQHLERCETSRLLHQNARGAPRAVPRQHSHRRMRKMAILMVRRSSHIVRL